MDKVAIVLIAILIISMVMLRTDDNSYTQQNVTITGNGWKEGSRTHDYIYPTNTGYVLNMPGSCDECVVGANITVVGLIYNNKYYGRNEMIVKRIIVNGTRRGWL